MSEIREELRDLAHLANDELAERILAICKCRAEEGAYECEIDPYVLRGTNFSSCTPEERTEIYHEWKRVEYRLNCLGVNAGLSLSYGPCVEYLTVRWY